MQPLTADTLPNRFETADEVDAFLRRPSAALIRDLEGLDGDIMVLGVAGKMGPTLAGLAKAAAPGKRVIGVARFSDPAQKAALERWGVETITCDLLDRERLGRLPQVPNIVFMAGFKFGAEGAKSLTWAMNAHVPALVAETFAASRIVAFSTGCVYPFVGLESGGAAEDLVLDPPGEYAQSCVGRERMFEHFSARHGTPGRLFRLNYAIDVRYGVLHDIAVKVKEGRPVDLGMGWVNVIWQGDANAQALRCLTRCTTPTSPINVTGPETLSVRWLAGEFGRRLGRQPVFQGTEAPTAWLSNTTEAVRQFGYPVVGVGHMLDWVADWVGRGQPGYGKPTKFEIRDGRY